MPLCCGEQPYLLAHLSFIAREGNLLCTIGQSSGSSGICELLSAREIASCLHGNGLGWLIRHTAQPEAALIGCSILPLNVSLFTGQKPVKCEGHESFPLLQLQCADLDACGWRWLARKPAAAGLGHEAGPDRANAYNLPQAREAAAWREVATTRVYTPAEGDLGGWLRVECTPVARHAATLLTLVLRMASLTNVVNANASKCC